MSVQCNQVSINRHHMLVLCCCISHISDMLWYTAYLSFGDGYEGVDELQLGLQVRGLVHILTALLHHRSYCLQVHVCKHIQQ